MKVTVHKSLPEGFTLATSAFDFVQVDLLAEGRGYEVVKESYVIASPSGEFHEFFLTEHTEYSSIEKYVKNEQLYVKK